MGHSGPLREQSDLCATKRGSRNRHGESPVARHDCWTLCDLNAVSLCLNLVVSVGASPTVCLLRAHRVLAAWSATRISVQPRGSDLVHLSKRSVRQRKGDGLERDGRCQTQPGLRIGCCAEVQVGGGTCALTTRLELV